MDIVAWFVTGAMLGWLAYAYLGLEERGLAASVVIGAIGGIAGGKIVAPMFTAAAEVQGAVTIANVIFAAAVAAAALAASNLVHKRWGV